MYPVLGTRLYFTSHKDDQYTIEQIKAHKQGFYFSSDVPEQYSPFCADFGPCNIGLLIRFCRHMNERNVNHACIVMISC
jgi:hypothetical protein